MKGPERDIHSGNDGGVFNEPLSDLTKLLASLVDSRNNIMVPGFYSGVRPNTLGAALQRLDKCQEFSLEGYREALGIPKLASAANMRWVPHHICSGFGSYGVGRGEGGCYTRAIKEETIQKQ